MMPIVCELLNKPDNCELIRDQIAGIIALEGANQFALALTEGIEDAKDFDIAAYVECSRPWELVGDGNASPFPLVNISLEKTMIESGSGVIDLQKFKATFNLDCYGCGNFSDAGDDRDAAIKAWKLARVVRNILSAGEYTYLGLRDVHGKPCVNSRRIEKMETGAPGNLSESAVAVIIVRIQLVVSYNEQSPQATGVAMGPMTIACEDSTGKVLFDF